jgi:hypothetical protein
VPENKKAPIWSARLYVKTTSISLAQLGDLSRGERKKAASFLPEAGAAVRQGRKSGSQMFLAGLGNIE